MKIEVSYNIGDPVWVIHQEQTRKQVYCCECHATEAREDILAVETDTAQGNGRRVVCAKCHGRGPEWVSSHKLVADHGVIEGFRAEVTATRTQIDYQVELDSGDKMNMVRKCYDSRESCEAAIEHGGAKCST